MKNEGTGLPHIGLDLAGFLAVSTAFLFAFGTAYEIGFINELGISATLVETNFHTVLFNGSTSFLISFLFSPLGAVASLLLLIISIFLVNKRSKFYLAILIAFGITQTVICKSSGKNMAEYSYNSAVTAVNENKAKKHKVEFKVDSEPNRTVEGIIIPISGAYVFIVVGSSILTIPKSNVIAIEFPIV